jgi:hypothetical protein
VAVGLELELVLLDVVVVGDWALLVNEVADVVVVVFEVVMLVMLVMLVVLVVLVLLVVLELEIGGAVQFGRRHASSAMGFAAPVTCELYPKTLTVIYVRLEAA